MVRNLLISISHNSALPSLLPITLPASRPRSSSLLSPDTLLGVFTYFTVPGFGPDPKASDPRAYQEAGIGEEVEVGERVLLLDGVSGSYRWRVRSF